MLLSCFYSTLSLFFFILLASTLFVLFSFYFAFKIVENLTKSHVFSVSDENRKLMDDILRQKVAEQQVSNFYQQNQLVKNENTVVAVY